MIFIIIFLLSTMSAKADNVNLTELSATTYRIEKSAPLHDNSKNSSYVYHGKKAKWENGHGRTPINTRVGNAVFIGSLVGIAATFIFFTVLAPILWWTYPTVAIAGSLISFPVGGISLIALPISYNFRNN